MTQPQHHRNPHEVLTLRRAALISAADDCLARHRRGVSDLVAFHTQLAASVAPFGATCRIDGPTVWLEGVGTPVSIPTPAVIDMRPTPTGRAQAEGRSQ